MAVELATAYVNITASARGIRQEIQREVGAPLEQETKRAGQRAPATPPDSAAPVSQGSQLSVSRRNRPGLANRCSEVFVPAGRSAALYEALSTGPH